MNLTSTIIPKSDQKNADDLLAGPQTITITSVESGTSKEQPVFIHYEGENGRPYKPCLSMRRVLVAMWGADGAAYVGRSLTLYCDPSVKFSGQAVGGIRISHATDICERFTIPLTLTRGNKKPFTVEPLVMQQAAKIRPVDELVAAGDAMAEQGVEKFRAWWNSSLSDAEKIALGGKDGDRMAAWKKAAAKVGA